jgi:rifampicin phosphotransferase
VAQGQLSRDAYLQQYGHRGAHEIEVSWPRPAEEPGWIERQLATLADTNVEVLLAQQQAEQAAAWHRFVQRYAGKAEKMKKRLAEAAKAGRRREEARSEMVRLLGVARTFALHAGNLTGLGEDMFFLSAGEFTQVLAGDSAPLAAIGVRREAHTRYSALPPYPTIINGRFDPFQWAADPNRRGDLFDSHQPLAAVVNDDSTIKGFAGAAGVVEGVVRRLDSAEEGHLLRPGEILVTATTNIGWTLLFPRAAAIVTDVGAPLSHAAIVARELGIPAVVGCGQATMRLKTGDRVRVNGGQGVVEILEPQMNTDEHG